MTAILGKLNGLCHAASARKHRKRGHEVRFSHWNGMHCVYRWSKSIELRAFVRELRP